MASGATGARVGHHFFREPFRARAARRLWRDRDVQGGSDTSRYAVASWEAGARPWFKSCVGQRALLGMGLSRLDPVPPFLASDIQ